MDQWHPFIFIILPSNKDEYFTKAELRNLEINQFRMATVKDLHYVISKFSEQGKEEKLGKKKVKYYLVLLSSQKSRKFGCFRYLFEVSYITNDISYSDFFSIVI